MSIFGGDYSAAFDNFSNLSLEGGDSGAGGQERVEHKFTDASYRTPSVG
jgi:hypothetical protein